MMKTCSLCKQTMELDKFGAHRQGKDGIRSRCKKCEVIVNSRHRKTTAGRLSLIAYVSREEIREKHKASYNKWIRTESGKNTKKMVESRYPNRRKARGQVNLSISKGLITREPCFICGEIKVVGHHPNYDQPLDVVWLCQAHHKQAHALAKKLDSCERGLTMEV